MFQKNAEIQRMRDQHDRLGGGAPSGRTHAKSQHVPATPRLRSFDFIRFLLEPAQLLDAVEIPVEVDLEHPSTSGGAHLLRSREFRPLG
jgi:hypothetical protein